jgi:hypothetical protein
VAIHTGTANNISVRTRGKAGLFARSIWPNWRCAGMRTVMTFLAQEWRTRLQQRRNVGTVRRMADGAVFRDGLMLKQEGAAFFRMAGIASFGDRIFLEQLGAGRAMRVVAIGTHHLAFTDGVMRDFSALCPLLFVTGIANFRLRFLVAHLVMRCVDFVARGASYVANLVSAAIPVRPCNRLLVASQARGILRLCRGANSTSGDGRVEVPAVFLTWASLSPWQD